MRYIIQPTKQRYYKRRRRDKPPGKRRIIMSKLLVREVITLKGWVDGSGWSYSQVYSDKIIDITEGDLKEIDWDWYDTDSDNPPSKGTDTQIIVDFYAEDADIGEDTPLASHTKWASEIWAERNR
jgi:hypothetical protein